MRKECVVSFETRSVEACHLLRPWIFDEDMLIRLECMWGLRYGTLDASSEANTIYLTPELRRMFESGLWALLPIDLQLINFIIEADFSIEEPIETAYGDKDFFEYIFVPLPGMEGIITRFDDKGPQDHLFPYTTLPVLRLHVQPHYAVVDLYEKIMKHELAIRAIRKDKGYKPYFLKYAEADLSCRCLYRLWKQWGVPPDFIGDPNTVYGDNSQTTSSGGERPPSLKLRPGAFAWEVDEVGLRPTDSVTYIPDREDGEVSSDDDEDEFAVDETDSAFETRMRRWVADVQLGLIPPDSRSLLLDSMKMDSSGETGNTSDIDAGSPTMVGTVVLCANSECSTHDMDPPYWSKCSISNMSVGSPAPVVVSTF